MNTQGKLIVFSAPSGSGKTTIVRHLLAQKALNLDFSISATSREKRGNEIDGKDYYFINKEKFFTLTKKNFFIETACVFRNHYGSPHSNIIQAFKNNNH
ncbi:MAG: guanylate kinase, partial [Lutibacter sp.]|nr:guanylate kinase [Lutibacter sp.]